MFPSRVVNRLSPLILQNKRAAACRRQGGTSDNVACGARENYCNVSAMEQV